MAKGVSIYQVVLQNRLKESGRSNILIFGILSLVLTLKKAQFYRLKAKQNKAKTTLTAA